MNKNKIIKGGICVLCGTAVGVGTTLFAVNKRLKFYKEYGILDEVKEVLDENKIALPDSLDDETAVVNGYLSLYDDKYTFYYKPVEASESTEPDAEETMTAEMLNGNILYVDIRYFNYDVNLRFGGEYWELAKAAKGIIFDLRDNGGGESGASFTLADRFLTEGYETEYYKDGTDYTKGLTNSGDELDVPIVILVNGKTASASEEMTALLKQFGKDVTIVGETTFGKGIFQNEEYLSNDGILRYTYGYYTIGDWECYQGIGIEPDIEIEMDSSLRGTVSDVQLKKALEILS